jgi:hypothetical protein
MESITEIVQQQANDALMKLGAQTVITAQEVAESVLHQKVYWEKLLPKGERLMFVRLFSPVIQREEVFLGSILLNNFLCKTFARVIADGNLGRVELIANDLENYYFLVCAASDLKQIVSTFRDEVESILPDLFFGEQDEVRGIYGLLENALDFRKSNVEPFPVFILPKEYAPRLERAVRSWLFERISKETFERNPTAITAALAFFYSLDGNEMQSPPRFIGRLAFRHGVIEADKLEEALNLPKLSDHEVEQMINNDDILTTKQKQALISVVEYIYDLCSTPRRLGWLSDFLSKTEKGEWELDKGKPKDQKPVERLLSKIEQMTSEIIFDEVVKSVIGYRFSNVGLCSKEQLRNLLEWAVTKLGENIDAGPATWLMPFVREKFWQKEATTIVDTLLSSVSIGYMPFISIQKVVEVGCRFCGVGQMVVEDKNILMGQSTHKFHNQISKQRDEKEPKACQRCGVSSFLTVKLMGSEMVGQFPAPKTCNLIFHYGKHDDESINNLTHKIDLIWNRIKTHQDKEREAKNIRDAMKELQSKLEREKHQQKREQLAKDLEVKMAEDAQAKAEVRHAINDLFAVCPWLAEPTPPYENAPLDIMAIGKLGEAKTERHILGVGMGGYRMILFIMPQLKPPPGKRGEPPPDPHLTQNRFSNSRITVMALLSFLREVCGCDGPFYYQSLPALTPDAFERNTFYIRNQPIKVKQAQDEYEVVTQLAWKLVRQRGSKGLVKKIVLAEKLLADPLGTFASIMRDSPILGVKRELKDENQPKILPGGYRKDWQTQDLTEYALFIQKLSKL